MRKLSIAVILSALFSAWPLGPGHASAPGKAEIWLFQGGAQRKLDSQSRGFEGLLSACESASTSSDQGKKLRLIVSQRMMDELRAKQSCIEVIYPEERRLQVGDAGPWVTLSRLLIPLTGGYARLPTPERTPRVVIFFGDTKYQSGPYTNEGSFQKQIRAELAEQGIDVPE